MKALKTKTGKQDRERRVLIGLIEHFLKTGKAVGSNALKEAGFHDLSSATIRNYFARLEEEGYLSQQHSSGGRIPTDRSFRLYAEEYVDTSEPIESAELKNLRENETREIATYLQKSAEMLSHLTNTPIFLSAPRFDRDFVTTIKLMAIDSTRCLCIIITDFGVIQTEVLHTEKKLSAFSIKRMEDYFSWRLTGHGKPENLIGEEEMLAQKFYNEVMVRYIVGYSNFIDEEIYRTGFSKLLAYSEFNDSSALAGSLALFENVHGMRLLLKECCKGNKIKFWIGEDLIPYAATSPLCTVIAIPYYIGHHCVGAIGLLGSTRIPYRYLFGLLKGFSESISETLTRSIYKFKISFRQPQPEALDMHAEERHILENSHLKLLENKSEEKEKGSNLQVDPQT